MSTYIVVVKGCHDETRTTVELTAEQADALYITAKALNEAAEYGCQPRMSVVATPSLTIDV